MPLFELVRTLQETKINRGDDDNSGEFFNKKLKKIDFEGFIN